MKLDVILGSKNRVKVLRGLLRRDSVCGREAGRAVDLSASAANIALSELVEAGIVFRNGTVGKHLYELNRGHYLMGALEKLFDTEGQLSAKISELVKKHLNEIKPRVELLGVGVGNEGVAVVMRPALKADDSHLRTLSIALRAEFGLTIEATSGELSTLAGYRDVKLALPDRQSEKSKSTARDKTLSFFGLQTTEGRRRQGGR